MEKKNDSVFLKAGLQGKTALVTGSSKGIGAAIALTMTSIVL